MPFNLAVFKPAAADAVIAAHPEITHWVIGGHSLGGAMAANYVYTHPDAVQGMALWAGYPAGNNSLADRPLAVTSVSATEDGLAIDGYAERKIPANAASGYLMPNDFGVLPSGILWLFYSNDYTNTELYSIDFATDKMLPSYDQRIIGTKMIGIDPGSVAYMCGSAFGPAKCVAVKMGSSSPEWSLDLDGAGTLGGALAPGRLYVVTKDGLLFAIGDRTQEK
jgi:pimeloyl-ACP methyl ester carboxylesterase